MQLNTRHLHNFVLNLRHHLDRRGRGIGAEKSRCGCGGRECTRDGGVDALLLAEQHLLWKIEKTGGRRV